MYIYIYVYAQKKQRHIKQQSQNVTQNINNHPGVPPEVSRRKTITEHKPDKSRSSSTSATGSWCSSPGPTSRASGPRGNRDNDKLSKELMMIVSLIVIYIYILYICVHVYIYIYIYIHTYMCSTECESSYYCVYIYIYIHIYAYTHAYIHTYNKWPP